MNKDDIKSAVEKLVPDKEMEQRLSEKILQKKYSEFSLKKVTSIAACVVVFILLGIFGYNFIDGRNATLPNSVSSETDVYIPKIDLSKKTKSSADMIGLIVYQGRIYTQSGTKVSFENAEKLLGEKLGITKGSIDEWSKQEDYAVEFASNIGKTDVYTVKGYDKSFRIMTYIKQEGNVYAEFFECLNGITIKRGDDVFGKLKLENNINSARFENFESWNNGKQQYKEIRNLQEVNNFINELKNTIPYTQESLSYLFDDQGNTNQKFIYVTLKDCSEVQLRLFKDGYVFYSNSHIFFKMEKKTFDKFWNEL